MAESTAVRLARMEENFSAQRSDIVSIKKHIEGNGKPGIIGRLDSVELKMAEQTGGRRMVGLICGSSVVTGLVVLCVTKLFN